VHKRSGSMSTTAELIVTFDVTFHDLRPLSEEAGSVLLPVLAAVAM